tara:strand:- start:442 stop:603 length:162 start_codon:yes stop_codon:yes gene_type:complete
MNAEPELFVIGFKERKTEELSSSFISSSSLTSSDFNGGGILVRRFKTMIYDEF